MEVLDYFPEPVQGLVDIADVGKYRLEGGGALVAFCLGAGEVVGNPVDNAVERRHVAADFVAQDQVRHLA